MKETKRFLIIEDRSADGIRMKLESRGFLVDVAGTVKQARKILNGQDDFDVCLVDMNLEKDPLAGSITGADLIIEYFQKNITRSDFTKPEVIIFTAYPHILEYYEKALKLGVASYLRKSDSPDEKIITHLRALSIKKALSNSKNLADKIEKVVKISRTETELYENFCREILGEEFRACLGTPFLLLLSRINSLTEPLHAQNCLGGTADLPFGEDIVYEQILSFMFTNADISEPFILDESMIGLLKTDKSNLNGNEIKSLQDAVFLSLPLAGAFRLTVGLLDSNEPYSESPKELGKLLNKYVNPTAIAFLSEIIARWHRNDSERKTTIDKMATFCQKVGQEQLFILENAALAGENLENPTYRTIRALAEDLYQTGRLLEPISNKNYSSENLEIFHMTESLKAAWEELSSEYKLNNINFFIEGDCEIKGAKEDFLLITLRILNWFVRRKLEIPANYIYSITVKCFETDEMSTIIFEDNSYRYPKELRKDLFKPFTQAVPIIDEKHKPGLYLALYLSQILIEEKYRGQIAECSDDLIEKMGNKIKIVLPFSRKI